MRPTCWNCGGNLWNRDEDGFYCALCNRRYSIFKDTGRIGGLLTLRRYGRKHFSKMGKKGRAAQLERSRNGRQ